MSRNLDFRSEAFQPYAKALGEVALIWNDFSMVLSTLFWAATKIPNGLVPNAMWNSLKSDRAQREMLLAVIDLKVLGHNIPAALRSEIKWVLKEAASLEDLRNDALHSPLMIDNKSAVFAWYQLGNKRASKFVGKNLLKELIWFYDTTLVLREYTEILTECFNQPKKPLPGRPQLPNRGRPNVQ